MTSARWMDKTTLRILNGALYKEYQNVTEETLDALTFAGIEVPANPYVAESTEVVFYSVRELVDEYRSKAISHWWKEEDAEREAKTGSGWYGAPNTISAQRFVINGTPPIYQEK